MDWLTQHVGARPGRIALIGMSLGGYFVTRAAGCYELRFATVIASTPFPEPGQLFGASVRAAMSENAVRKPSSAASRSKQMMAWLRRGTWARWEGVRADPSRVTLPSSPL